MQNQNKNQSPENPPAASKETAIEPPLPSDSETALPKEIGGRKGPEPTRYGDWEKNGRCIDF